MPPAPPTPAAVDWHLACDCSHCLAVARGAAIEEGVMSHLITRRRLLGALEHILAIVVGFILMVVGLGLGVTMIMLPAGLVIGFLGLAIFVGGMCVRFEWV